MMRAIWATSWENLFMAYANNKGIDQLKSETQSDQCLYCSLPDIAKISRLASLISWAGRLSLDGSQTPKTSFLVTWLIISWIFLSLLLREPVQAICEQQTDADQLILAVWSAPLLFAPQIVGCLLLPYPKFLTLTSFWSWAGWFEPYLYHSCVSQKTGFLMTWLLCFSAMEEGYLFLIMLL